MDFAKRWLQLRQTFRSFCQSPTKLTPTAVIDVGDAHLLHYLIKLVLRSREDITSGSQYPTLSHQRAALGFLQEPLLSRCSPTLPVISCSGI